MLGVVATVLIVDDHAGFRASARRLLEADGYAVVGEAADGAAGIAAAIALRPDLVLLDVALPDASGFDVARAMGVPVVLTSSREWAPDLVAASGARGFVGKADLSGAALAAVLGMRNAVAVLGGVACVAVLTLVEASMYRYSIESLAVLGPVIAAAFIATGVWIWRRLGALMVVTGFAFLASTLAGADAGGLYAVGFVCSSLSYATLSHLLLAFPDGRLRGVRDRLLVVGGYLIAGVYEGLQLLIYDPGFRANPLMVDDRPDLFDATEIVQAVISIAALTAVGVILAGRYRDADPARRVALRPVLGAGVIIVASLVITLVADLVAVSETLESVTDTVGRVAVLLVPALFLLGKARTRLGQLEDDVRASSARLVAATDAERRRLERDLHDGAQQRLVSLALTLRLARRRADGELAGLLEEAATELQQATDELRELARGIHPAVLTDRGLGAAIDALAARSPVPVRVDEVPAERLPGAVESAAYFLVAEALTNVTRYAGASEATVSVQRRNGHVTVAVADDGVGGADADAGTGLRGLADRIGALGGTVEVTSPPGAGTVVRAELPCGS